MRATVGLGHGRAAALASAQQPLLLFASTSASSSSSSSRTSVATSSATCGHGGVPLGGCRPRPAAAAIPRSTRTRTQVAATPGAFPGLAMLANTRPIDRLRFQALLVLSQFDSDGDGKLSLEEVGRFTAFASARLGAAATVQLQPLYDAAAATAASAPGRQLDAEDFVQLIRDQVKAVAAMPIAKQYLTTHHTAAEVARLGFKTSLSASELASSLLVFQLLDYDGDKFLKLGELRKAQGIEREVVEGVLDDADDNEDGLLSFEDWLSSYAREKPILLNMVVLAAHSLVYWFVFNLPLDVFIKTAICMGLVLQPQIITGAATKVFTIVRSVYNRIRAEIEMSRSGITA